MCAGGSIIVKQVGHAVLTVALPSGGKEEYLITLPRLRIDGLWYGSPYIELAETSYIQGSNGWQSVVWSLSVSSIHACSWLCVRLSIRARGTSLGPHTRLRRQLRILDIRPSVLSKEPGTPLRRTSQTILHSTMSRLRRRKLLSRQSKNKVNGRADACGMELPRVSEKATLRLLQKTRPGSR